MRPLVFVLEVLNSAILNFYHRETFLDKEKITFQKVLIANCKKLPIPTATPGEQAAIASKVEQILAAKAHDPAADVSTLERDIDELVADLYGLDDAEKQLVGLPPRADGSTPSPAPASVTSSFNSPSAARAAAEGDASQSDQPARPPKTVPPVAEVRDRSTPSPDISSWDESSLLCVARSTLARGGELTRDDAIRQIATDLGFNRTGPRIRETLESALRVAVRRSILGSTPGGGLTLATRTIDDYTRDDLIKVLLSAMGRAWIEREDAIKLASRYLGFARTGKQIQAAFKSAINGAIRRGVLEYEGSQIRRI